jgi:hypothetical protein
VPALQVSPIVAALDHPEVTLDRETVPAVALSLVDAFAQVPDPRNARGIRHGVTAILLLGACAVLTGARSFAAIAEYAHDTPSPSPCAATSRRSTCGRRSTSYASPPSSSRAHTGEARFSCARALQHHHL